MTIRQAWDHSTQKQLHSRLLHGTYIQEMVALARSEINDLQGRSLSFWLKNTSWMSFSASCWWLTLVFLHLPSPSFLNESRDLCPLMSKCHWVDAPTCSVGESVAFFFFFWAMLCGMQDPSYTHQGWNPCPLQWKCRVLTNGLPGKSPIFITF